jgi:hypothetical protein
MKTLIEVLNQEGQLRFFRRLPNFDEWRIAASRSPHSFSPWVKLTPFNLYAKLHFLARYKF